MTQIEGLERNALIVAALVFLITTPLALLVRHAINRWPVASSYYGAVAFAFAAACTAFWFTSVGDMTTIVGKVDTRLDVLEEYLAKVGDRPLQNALRRIAAHWASKFEGADEGTKRWIRRAVDDIADDMAGGWAPIPVEDAPRGVGDLMASAQTLVLISTKGVGAYWIEDKNYTRGREVAAYNCPIVQYHYFYDGLHERLPRGWQRIQFRDAEEVSERVSRYDGTASVACRSLIDVSGKTGFRHRELVLIDVTKIIEAELDDGGSPMKVRVSEAPDHVREAAKYFRTLYDQDEVRCRMGVGKLELLERYENLLGSGEQITPNRLLWWIVETQLIVQ